ncbi:MAG: transposase [Candidatus Heimdallarchaeum endolithica]|uniref:Transposase n=1 Tax=Candidatus Heimdallarchaeum endolithica TaxID=2876572 RepID=A0A9Y1BR92_9ARCH|nr:MAG: transposase [Candidatus Heimdallarchaeum endolithica]
MMEDVVKTLKMRIKNEVLTTRKKERLRRITGRDTKIIEKYVRIIHHNRRKICRRTKKGKIRVHRGKLDKLTLTTSKVKEEEKRTTVPHDLKKMFPYCSHNEFQECRDIAVQLYEQGYRPRSTRPPIKRARRQLINAKRFILVHLPKEKDNTLTRWWVGIRDSLDTWKRNTPYHQKLWLPLEMSTFHQKELKKGKIKSLELRYKRSTREWWVYFQLRVLPSPSFYPTKEKSSSSLPPAVLGIDLGINIPATGVLLTPKNKLTNKEIKFWYTKQWNKVNHRYKLKLSRLQRKAALNDQSGKKHQIYRFLGLLRKRYRNVKRAYIHQFINDVVQMIETYARMYDLFVVVGYPKNVRKGKEKGKGKSTRYFRRKLYQWNFSLVLSLLRRALILRGFAPHRILTLDERGTSSHCSRCGKEVSRPVRGLIHCPFCNYTYHSDLTGARNIARKFLSHLFRPRTTTITDYFTGQKFSLTHYTVCRGLSHWLQSQ